jgi:hypothetical protein
VAELPVDEAGRRRLFEWESAFAKAIETESAHDVGQKYLKIVLD